MGCGTCWCHGVTYQAGPFRSLLRLLPGPRARPFPDGGHGSRRPRPAAARGGSPPQLRRLVGLQQALAVHEDGGDHVHCRSGGAEVTKEPSGQGD